jgi:hypothetical protein
MQTLKLKYTRTERCGNPVYHAQLILWDTWVDVATITKGAEWYAELATGVGWSAERLDDAKFWVERQLLGVISNALS